MSYRIGQGYDVHRLVPGRRLVLGGVEIESDVGLEGFSDADVILHALGDALLGAAGLGDLGTHFPPGEAAWRDADSAELLARIAGMVAERRLAVVNCDVTLIGERPKLAPYREAIERRITELLDLEDERRVSIKATTHEGLGTIGRGEGLAASAVVLLREID